MFLDHQYQKIQRQKDFFTEICFGLVTNLEADFHKRFDVDEVHTDIDISVFPFLSDWQITITIKIPWVEKNIFNQMVKWKKEIMQEYNNLYIEIGHFDE